MKIKILVHCVVAVLVSSSFLTSCEKKDSSPKIPSLTTHAPAAVTDSTAVTGGTITSDGGNAILERGVCYGETDPPTVAGRKQLAQSDDADFTCTITGLMSGTTYYVRAYALNSAGTGYGSTESFTTSNLRSR